MILGTRVVQGLSQIKEQLIVPTHPSHIKPNISTTGININNIQTSNSRRNNEQTVQTPFRFLITNSQSHNHE